MQFDNRLAFFPSGYYDYEIRGTHPLRTYPSRPADRYVIQAHTK
jgi:hypothetical protein